MTVSKESMDRANELHQALVGQGMMKEGINLSLFGSIIGAFIEEAWQQGFSDCEMAQRIERMRKSIKERKK